MGDGPHRAVLDTATTSRSHGACRPGVDPDGPRAFELTLDARWKQRESGGVVELDGNASLVDLRQHDLVVLLHASVGEAGEIRPGRCCWRAIALGGTDVPVCGCRRCRAGTLVGSAIGVGDPRGSVPSAVSPLRLRRPTC